MPVKRREKSLKRTERRQRVEDLERRIRAASAQRILYSGVLANRLGLHQTDLECLFIITLSEDVTPGRLARETGLTSGAITGVVDRIEKAGYIRRVRDPDDRRRWFLQPVQPRIDEIRAINLRATAPWLDELAAYSDAELDVLLDFAERYYQATVNATIALRSETNSR